MKKFKCAAIRYKNSAGNLVERGGTTYNKIIKLIHDVGDIELYNKWHEEGFIYGEDVQHIFVDRDRATEIAKQMGIHMMGSRLTPEDLW